MNFIEFKVKIIVENVTKREKLQLYGMFLILMHCTEVPKNLTKTISEKKSTFTLQKHDFCSINPCTDMLQPSPVATIPGLPYMFLTF